MPPTTTSTTPTPSQTITRLLHALRALQAPPPLPPPSITAPPPPSVLHRLLSPSNHAARTILLTLHLLFPHDFLPALDLLDRGLVTCLTPVSSAGNTTTIATTTATTAITPATSTATTPQVTTPAHIPHPTHRRARAVYYIQSASAISEGSYGGSNYGAGSAHGGDVQGGRFRNAVARGRGKATDTFYEVRLDSWNCSCAAFAAQGFGLLGIDEGAGFGGGGIGGDGGEGRERMGGEGGETEGEMDFMFGGTVELGGIAPVCKHILAAAMAKNLPEFVMPPARDGKEWKREVSAKELAGWGAGWGDRG